MYDVPFFPPVPPKGHSDKADPFCFGCLFLECISPLVGLQWLVRIFLVGYVMMSLLQATKRENCLLNLGKGGGETQCNSTKDVLGTRLQDSMRGCKRRVRNARQCQD